jgi:tRNA-2-methylthio-N6-dimethylallyladenosine synthase
VHEVGFSAAFCFKYSVRPHTPALRLEDDVTEAEKDDRLARLFAAVETTQRAQLASLVGTRTTVLIEDVGRENDDGVTRWKGRSERHEIVHVEAPPELDLRGQLVSASIQHANAHSLMGRLEEDLSGVPRRDAVARTSEPASPAQRRRLPVTKSA